MILISDKNNRIHVAAKYVESITLSDDNDLVVTLHEGEEYILASGLGSDIAETVAEKLVENLADSGRMTGDVISIRKIIEEITYTEEE